MAERLDALTVRESNGKSFWTKIGAAFPNREGGGYMLKLDAVPASNDGQYTIHLRVPRPREDGQQRSNQGGGGGGYREPQQRQSRSQARDDLDGDDVPFVYNDGFDEWRAS